MFHYIECLLIVVNSLDDPLELDLLLFKRDGLCVLLGDSLMLCRLALGLGLAGYVELVDFDVSDEGLESRHACACRRLSLCHDHGLNRRLRSNSFEI